MSPPPAVPSAAGWEFLATRQLWLQSGWVLLQLAELWQAGDVGFWLICVFSGWPTACLHVVWALQDVCSFLCAASLVSPLLLMPFCFLPKLWQPTASTYFWPLPASATCGSDKARRGIKTHCLGVTGGADWKNFPGIGCAGLNRCAPARGRTWGSRSPVLGIL